MVSEAEIVFTRGRRGTGARVGAKSSPAMLKVNVLASAWRMRASGSTWTRSTCTRAKRARELRAAAAAELRLKEETVKADLGRVLLKLEMLQERRRRRRRRTGDDGGR